MQVQQPVSWRSWKSRMFCLRCVFVFKDRGEVSRGPLVVRSKTEILKQTRSLEYIYFSIRQTEKYWPNNVNCNTGVLRRSTSHTVLKEGQTPTHYKAVYMCGVKQTGTYLWTKVENRWHLLRRSLHSYVYWEVSNPKFTFLTLYPFDVSYRLIIWTDWNGRETSTM